MKATKKDYFVQRYNNAITNGLTDKAEYFKSRLEGLDSTPIDKILEDNFKLLEGGIVATPNNREDLEAFAKANNGSMDILLMQMAIQYGYKIALENIKEQLTGAI
jgi:hypothetical protein